MLVLPIPSRKGTQLRLVNSPPFSLQIHWRQIRLRRHLVLNSGVLTILTFPGYSIMSSSNKEDQISLEEFKSSSPGDLSPLAFVQWRAGAPYDKERLHRAYVAIFTQAKTSPFLEIRRDGEEMERLWKNKGTSLQDHWATKSLTKQRV